MSTVLPGTDARVGQHTAPGVSARLRTQAIRDIERHVGASERELTARIEQLKREWDVERTLEANAATIALAGLGLGLAVDRRFLALPALVGGFLLQHALQGWCPPLPLFRAAGVRTAAEIHREIVALKILRGDFDGITRSDAAALHAASVL